MPDDQYEANSFNRAAYVAEGLDAVLAMLLLSRRVHVESLSLIEPDLARVELSGEAVEQGLAAVAEVLTLAPQIYKRTRAKNADAVEDPAKGGSTAGSLWQALKDFALPPAIPPRDKTK